MEDAPSAAEWSSNESLFAKREDGSPIKLAEVEKLYDQEIVSRSDGSLCADEALPLQAPRDTPCFGMPRSQSKKVCSEMREQSFSTTTCGSGSAAEGETEQSKFSQQDPEFVPEPETKTLWAFRKPRMKTAGLEGTREVRKVRFGGAQHSSSDEVQYRSVQPSDTEIRYVRSIVQQLGDADQSVREAAMDKLGEQEPSTLAEHANTIAKCLNDANWQVRQKSLRVVRKMEPLAYATHPSYGTKTSAQWIRALGQAAREQQKGMKPKSCIDYVFNLEVLSVFNKLQLSALAQHAVTVSHILGAESVIQRCAMLMARSTLHPLELAEHAAVTARSVEDESMLVRWMAIVVLCMLEAAVLVQHVPLGRLFMDPYVHVRIIAFVALHKLELAAASLERGSITSQYMTMREHLFVALSSYDPSTCFPCGHTLLHCAAYLGLSQTARFMVSYHRIIVLDARNNNGETPLHVAASNGNLDICMILAHAGAFLRARSACGKTPEDSAREANHHDVVECLRNCGDISSMRSGVGDALAAALVDTRQVQKVEWYFVEMPGIGDVKDTTHSFLKITVGSANGGTHAYVLEKASMASVSYDPSQFDNDTVISHWSDVAPGIRDKPIHILHESDIEDRSNHITLTMRALREKAIEQGPHDGETCNSHHLAIHVYNFCAKEHATVMRTPDTLLSRIVTTMSLGSSLLDWSHGQSSSEFLDNPASRNDTPVLIKSQLQDLNLSRSRLACQLCKWVQAPLAKTLGKPCALRRQDDIAFADGADSLQWAIVVSNETIFVAFKGTPNAIDIILEGNYFKYDHAAHGVQVHDGIWNSLHQGNDPVAAKIIARVRELQSEDRSLTEVVVCGHSFGGGTALIAALDMLYAGVRVSAVITFGALQVMIPNPDSQVWCDLDAIAISYVNAFDPIPRLPSCERWLFEIVPDALMHTDVSSSGSGLGDGGQDDSPFPRSNGLPHLLQHFQEHLGPQRVALRSYDTVGTLLLVVRGNRYAMRLSRDTHQQHRGVLERPPDPSAGAILQQHAVEEYLAVVTDLKSANWPMRLTD